MSSLALPLFIVCFPQHIYRDLENAVEQLSELIGLPLNDSFNIKTIKQQILDKAVRNPYLAPVFFF